MTEQIKTTELEKKVLSWLHAEANGRWWTDAVACEAGIQPMQWTGVSTSLKVKGLGVEQGGIFHLTTLGEEVAEQIIIEQEAEKWIPIEMTLDEMMEHDRAIMRRRK